MKTIFRFIIAAMAAISVFSSCQKELANETASSTTDGVRTISVQFDNSTKASLSGLAPTFTNNDKIRVSNTEKSEECTVTVSEATATFTTTLSGALTAIYPADAAVYTSGTPDGPISSPYFKVSASQDGTIEKAIIAKAEIADGSSSATFIGQTALFQITPPSGATSVTITSLKQIGTDGQRSGTAAAINDDTDDMKKCEITVAVPTGGTAYVSLVPGVDLTDLSFDAGKTYGMKGIPMKDITAGKTNATAANTKYTIGNSNNTWHPYVVINGLKWATMNIGASSATDAGTYFAWGDVEGQTWSGSAWSGSGFSSDPGIGDPTKLRLEYDAANANWGGSWRMPTQSEFDALASLRKGDFASGYHFGGDTEEAQIFLPAAGWGLGADLTNVDAHGHYWSSSAKNEYPHNPYNLYFVGGFSYTRYDGRNNGQSVRALSE